jgi:hypothetical protein
MADLLRTNYWMEPHLDTPGVTVTYGHEGRFPCGVIYSNKASKWYRYRDSSDPFEVISEIGRIETLKYLSFQMVRKQVSHDFFKKVHAKQTKFTLHVGYLLNSVSAGKETLIKQLEVVYYQSVLAQYEVDPGFEEGRITFEDSAEVTYVPFKPKAG